jgi:phage protein D
MTFSAVDIRYYAPEFLVSINGGRLPAEVVKTILNIRVEQEMNRLNNFSFEVQDEAREGQFCWLGHELFQCGNDVSIQIGFANRLIEVAEGKIQNVDARFLSGTGPSFSVQGSDRAYAFLMNRSGPQEFLEKTDSQIVEEIAGMAQLRSTVEGTGIAHPVKFKEGGSSYFEFLQELARINGFELRLSGRDFFFGSSWKAVSGVPFDLTWGRELIDFTGEINTSRAVSEVVVRSWDRSRRTTIEGKAWAGDEGTGEIGNTASQIARQIYGDVVKVVTDQPVGSNEEARQMAVAILRERSAGLVRGSGNCFGIADMKPGSELNLYGMGDWFSGRYLVEKIVHSIDESGFRTNFTAARNFL